MTDAIIEIEGGTLLATGGEGMELDGLLVPYGEVGSTNLGRFTVEPSSFTIPADLTGCGVNVDHVREDVVGTLTAAESKQDGIHTRVRFADTDEGRAALEDARSGKRSKLSVEVKGVVVRAGKAVAGSIFGAALVKRPAFPSATLLAAAADTAPETVTQPVPAANAAPLEVQDGTLSVVATTAPDQVVVQPADAEDSITYTPKPETNEEGDGDVANATAPNTLTATAPKRSGLSKQDVFGILYAIRSGRATPDMLDAIRENSGPGEQTLFAALNDVKLGGAGANITVPQWVGELWDGVAYQQIALPLFTHESLTSLKISGFRWTTKPSGGTWSGDKSAVPTNTPATESVTETAKRFAGGHDIGREFRDFNVPGFFESYYAAMAESYAKWADETVVLGDVKSGATSMTADNPSGLDIGKGMSAIIDGAAEVIAAHAVPSFALVESSLWKSIAKTPSKDTLGYLSAALNLRDGELDQFVIRPTDQLSTGNVLVGAREAATVYELPGVPIRVEAEDMVKGGIDTGVFGYAGVVINKATALQLVAPYSAG